VYCHHRRGSTRPKLHAALAIAKFQTQVQLTLTTWRIAVVRSVHLQVLVRKSHTHKVIQLEQATQKSEDRTAINEDIGRSTGLLALG